MIQLLKQFSINYIVPASFTVALFIVSPSSVQAANSNHAQTTKAAIARSCPNRLCPVVQTLPSGTNFVWVLSKNGFVNIANTTFWVSTSDIK